MKYHLDGLIGGFFLGLCINSGFIFFGRVFDLKLSLLIVFTTSFIIWLGTVILNLFGMNDLTFSKSTSGFLLGFTGPFLLIAYTYAANIKGLFPIVLFMLLILFSMVGFIIGLYVEKEDMKSAYKRK